MKKLYKSRMDVKIDGICGGFAEYLGLDPTLIRLVWAASIFCGVGIPAYIICAIIMPRDPGYIDQRDYEPRYDPHRNSNGQ